MSITHSINVLLHPMSRIRHLFPSLLQALHLLPACLMKLIVIVRLCLCEPQFPANIRLRLLVTMTSPTEVNSQQCSLLKRRMKRSKHAARANQRPFSDGSSIVLPLLVNSIILFRFRRHSFAGL